MQVMSKFWLEEPLLYMEDLRLLERRRADLAALDRRLTLVPDLALVGMAAVSFGRMLKFLYSKSIKSTS
jgi:hypothetical protein